MTGHLDKIYDADWSSDGLSLVTCAQDGKLIVYDAVHATKTHRVDLESRWVIACAYSPATSSPAIVASGGLDNACSLYALNDAAGTGELKRVLTGHDGYIASMR